MASRPSTLNSLIPFTLSGVAKLVALCVFALNYKNLPFFWHVRSIYSLIKAIVLRRLLERSISARKLLESERKELIAAEFLKEYSLAFWASPGDCDWNMHVNNAIYNTTTDFSRYDMVIQSGLGRYLSENKCGLANGGVAFAYMREIPIGSRFWVRSRFVTWDRKWLVMEHRFENREGTIVYAIGHARMVVKRLDRRTVPPSEVVRAIGLPESKIDRVIPDCCKAVLQAERALEMHGEEDMLAKGAKKEDLAANGNYLRE
ncbi:hypothetical protein HDU93_007191 [Gonapodya sp. JEL0774]|nr:hypothetical protein HDU93_007191 [Gonapodya sp. JEL0774]